MPKKKRITQTKSGQTRYRLNKPQIFMDHKQSGHMNEQERNAHLAHVLGISPEELMRLHHSGLKEVTDSELQVYKYYINFSHENPPDILDKLDMDVENNVYFSAAEWEHEKES